MRASRKDNHKQKPQRQKGLVTDCLDLGLVSGASSNLPSQARDATLAFQARSDRPSDSSGFSPRPGMGSILAECLDVI